MDSFDEHRHGRYQRAQGFKPKGFANCLQVDFRHVRVRTCEADKEVVFYSVRNGTYLTADQLSWLFWLGLAALLTCTVLQGKSWQPNSMSSSL